MRVKPLVACWRGEGLKLKLGAGLLGGVGQVSSSPSLLAGSSLPGVLSGADLFVREKKKPAGKNICKIEFRPYLLSYVCHPVVYFSVTKQSKGRRSRNQIMAD